MYQIYHTYVIPALAAWHVQVHGAEPVGWMVTAKKVCPSPKHQNLWEWPYLEKNIFVGIIDLRIILDYWVGLKVNDRVLIRERQQGIWDPEAWGRRPQEDRGRAGGMRLQAKEYLEPPEAGRYREGVSPRAFRESMAPRTPPWFQNSGLQNCKRMNVCCFRPPSLWWLITAAPGS